MEEKVIPMPDRCPACGYPRSDGDHRCEKCGRRFVISPPPPRAPVSPRTPLLVEGSAAPLPAPKEPAFPEPLRRHLRSRVEQFRERRYNPSLPFEGAEEEEPRLKIVPIRRPADVVQQERKRTVAVAKPREASDQPVSQENLAFPTPPQPEIPVEPPRIATFALRASGNLVDAVLILTATFFFLTPYYILAGPLLSARLGLGVGFGACVLLALIYGVIFLYVAGATPGMKSAGLKLVNFDGLPASSPQRFVRFLGAVVSGASFFVGFAWAIVDEEGLSWHDRISKTFLAATPR